MRKFCGRYYQIVVGALWTFTCFVFFQFCYPYHFFYQEQSQIFLWSWDYVSTYFSRPGGLAVLIGDFLTQFFYYLYVGATIVTLCLLVLGRILRLVLKNLGCNRHIAFAVSILVMTFVAVCHFNHAYRLSSTISMIGWACVLWLISLIKIKGGKRKWGLRCIFLVLSLFPAYLLWGSPQIKKIGMPDFILEKNFAVDNEYYFGNYAKVIEMVEGSEQWTKEMLFFYNLVQAQRGQLPDHLLSFTPNELGTFYKIGPETPLLTIRNMNELYWALGDMTFTERAAMMANVFSRDNRNVRMIRRLAECSIVSSDTLAAEKYLRLLDKTFVYRIWAQNIRANGENIYRDKMRFVNRHDTITTTDNAHFLMMQLLDTNPDNTVALDYILCSNLLLKDIANFKRDYDRYCMETGKSRIKTLYQEALCIWLAGSDASQEEWRKYIQRPDIVQRFMEYNKQRGNPRFKGSYWYYFDKTKAPEV